mgnify:FL=1
MDNQGPNNYNYNNGPGNNGSGGNGNNGGNRPGGNGGRNNRGGQGIMAFILLTLVALFVYALISNSISHASTQEKSYSDFIKQLDKGNVKSVEFDSYEIDYKLVDDGHKDYDITYYTGRVADDELVPTLKKAKTSEGKSIEIKAAIPDNTSTWIFNILSFIVPLILLWVLLAFVSKKMGGSMGMGVGKTTARYMWRSPQASTSRMLRDRMKPRNLSRRLLISFTILRDIQISEPSFLRERFSWDLREQVRHSLPRQ